MEVTELACVCGLKNRTSGWIQQNSLLISLLAGNLHRETGSQLTGCATKQSRESLIPETLRERPALTRPVRRTISIFGL
jgi:hypothetical protein